MESPDEYLGRLNFLGTLGSSERRGAPLQCRGGRSQVCLCVCVCVVRLGHGNSGGRSPPIPIDFTSVSLYSNFISVASAVLGVCVQAAVGDEPSRLPGWCLSCRRCTISQTQQLSTRINLEEMPRQKSGLRVSVNGKSKVCFVPVYAYFLLKLSERLP